MKRYTFNALAIVVVLASLAAPSKAEDIVDTAVKAGSFKTLVTAVKAADLVETLKGKGPFTVFAPTDEAFGKIPKKDLQGLLKPNAKGKLTSILTYHVVPGKVMAKDAFGLDGATTVNGQRLSISRDSGQLMINDSKVVATDIECDNGVIHVIDSVLIPETRTIPEVASEAKAFSTLLAAVTTAELAETLSGEGPFTVFAPTDEAFAKLPKGTVESLLKPENRKQLVKILTYHVVAGRVFAEDAVKAENAKTLQGQPVNIKFGAKGVQINDAKLIKADIQASNGVIHVIDQVLLPKTLSTSQARDVLERAVTRGARAFNAGDLHTCCSVYEAASKQLIESGEDLPEAVAVVLNASLGRAKSIKHEGERARLLRHGIDLAYYSLND